MEKKDTMLINLKQLTSDKAKFVPSFMISKNIKNETVNRQQQFLVHIL